MDTLDLIVTDKQGEAEGVVSLTLASATGLQLPVWQPGAHVEITLPSGLIRHYSLCGDPIDRHRYKVAVLREEQSRGGSQEVHDKVQVGTPLRIRGPRNHFELVPADSYLFIGGGIGITPLLPMVARAEAEGRPWRLAYGGRTAESMAFVEEVQSRAGGKVELYPEDRVGRPDLAALLSERSDGSAVYCCGPEGLIHAVEEECRRLGIADALHVERFAAAGAVAEAVAEVSSSVEVHLAKTGATIRVPPARTLLDAIREVVAEVPSSCEEGICGTCETAVIEGVPDHRDDVLSAAEKASGGTMMICVSRSKTPRLVLDL